MPTKIELILRCTASSPESDKGSTLTGGWDLSNTACFPMKFLFVTVCFFTLNSASIAIENNSLSPAEEAAGWRLLFDGQDASRHWRSYNKETFPAEWTIQGGALARGGGGDIITKDKFESFELSIEWKISEAGNSGIMFKVVEKPRVPSYATGPEVNLLDNIKGTDSQKAGWLYQLYPSRVDTTKPVGEWNLFVLRCQRTPAGTYKCSHWMNEVKYVDYEIGSNDWKRRLAQSKFADWEGYGTAAAGHICLQDHGDLVWFRNIKILELPPLESPTSGYNTWRAENFTLAERENPAVSAPTADPDQDDIPNLLEAALGTLPKIHEAASETLSIAHVTVTGSSQEVGLLSATSSPAVIGIRLRLQVNLGLAPGDWTTIAERTGTAPWISHTSTAIDQPYTINRRASVTFLETAPAATSSRRFYRLHAEIVL